MNVNVNFKKTTEVKLTHSTSCTTKYPTTKYRTLYRSPDVLKLPAQRIEPYNTASSINRFPPAIVSQNQNRQYANIPATRLDQRTLYSTVLNRDEQPKS